MKKWYVVKYDLVIRDENCIRRHEYWKNSYQDALVSIADERIENVKIIEYTEWDVIKNGMKITRCEAEQVNPTPTGVWAKQCVTE